MASTALPVLSPLVTRILEVSGFSPDLKTRDIQAAFVAWEEEKGGYRIKWINDTSVLIVFNDAATGESIAAHALYVYRIPGCVSSHLAPPLPFRTTLDLRSASPVATAKKAYLKSLVNPPAMLGGIDGRPAKIRPYDGADASTIIQSVHHRARSRSNAGLAGIMAGPGGGGGGGEGGGAGGGGGSGAGMPSSASGGSLAGSPSGAAGGAHRHTASNASIGSMSGIGSGAGGGAGGPPLSSSASFHRGAHAGGGHHHSSSNHSIGLSASGSSNSLSGAGTGPHGHGHHGHGHSAGQGSGSFKLGHFRHPSGSNPSSLPAKPVAAALYDAANGGPSPAQHLANAARDEGVPLPPIPTVPLTGKGAAAGKRRGSSSVGSSAAAAAAAAVGAAIKEEDAGAAGSAGAKGTNGEGATTATASNGAGAGAGGKNDAAAAHEDHDDDAIGTKANETKNDDATAAGALSKQVEGIAL